MKSEAGPDCPEAAVGPGYLVETGVKSDGKVPVQAQFRSDGRLKPEIEVPVPAGETSGLQLGRLRNLPRHKRTTERRLSAEDGVDGGQDLGRHRRVGPHAIGGRVAAG